MTQRSLRSVRRQAAGAGESVVAVLSHGVPRAVAAVIFTRRDLRTVRRGTMKTCGGARRLVRREVGAWLISG
jgi:hypothetical protein